MRQYVQKLIKLTLIFFSLSIIFFYILYINIINNIQTYRNYIAPLIDTANEKLKEVQQRISERISDAGRKLSDRMRAQSKYRQVNKYIVKAL